MTRTNYTELLQNWPNLPLVCVQTLTKCVDSAELSFLLGMFTLRRLCYRDQLLLLQEYQALNTPRPWVIGGWYFSI